MKPASARMAIRIFAVSRIVISVVTRCATSAGGWLIWTPMKMAPAAAAQRPAAAKRRLVVMLMSHSFVRCRAGCPAMNGTVRVDVVSAHHHVM